MHVVGEIKIKRINCLLLFPLTMLAALIACNGQSGEKQVLRDAMADLISELNEGVSNNC